MDHEQLQRLGNIGSTVSYTGSGVSLLAFVNANAAALGLLIGVLTWLVGLLVNIYFKRRSLAVYTKRMAEERRNDTPAGLEAFKGEE